MLTLSFWTDAELTRVGNQIRKDVAELRKRQLVLSAAKERPSRNPDLDSPLTQLQLLRVDLDARIIGIEADAVARAVELPLVDHARRILADVADLVDLLIWFGAKPLDAKVPHQPSAQS